MGDERIDVRKRELRRELRARRKALPHDERAAVDAALAARVESLPEWREARTVLAYLSFGAEVDTRALIAEAWREGRVVALPRCVAGTRDMRWYVVDSLDGLERSPLGVEEPAEDPARELDPTSVRSGLALVPGLAFDARGFRVGYGGGFYDAFLARLRAPSVGLCRSAFLVDDLYGLGVVDAHDLPAGIVITDRAVVRARPKNLPIPW